jgi:hypothetical protein
VWNLPILDGQVLKREYRPFFPALQGDLDALVGQGVVHVVKSNYAQADDGTWRLHAEYTLVAECSDRILAEIRRHDQQLRTLDFIQEVVFAISGLGPDGIDRIGLLDATYSNPLVDIGGLIDFDADPQATNATARVAMRFAQLTQDTRVLTDTELVHLYVRHLYSRMRVA